MFLAESYLFLQLPCDLYTLLFGRADISQSKREKIDNTKREYFKRKCYSSIELGNWFSKQKNDFKLFDYQYTLL